jgi:hypothetical protein
MDKYVVAENGIAFVVGRKGMTLSEAKAKLKELKDNWIDGFYSYTPIINGVYFVQFREKNGTVQRVVNRYEVMPYNEAIFE